METYSSCVFYMGSHDRSNRTEPPPLIAYVPYGQPYRSNRTEPYSSRMFHMDSLTGQIELNPNLAVCSIWTALQVKSN
jgi:hypothetical protein